MKSLDPLIEELKKDYDDIYYTIIGDADGELVQEFIFREITKKEYNDLLDIYAENNPVLQEEVCRVCTLYPAYDFTQGLGGTAESLSNMIIEASGLMDGQAISILEKHREEMQLFDYQVECIIHEAFPNIPLEEISNWTIKKTLYYFSRAEWVLENLKDVHMGRSEAMQQQQEEYDHQYVFDQQGQESYEKENIREGELSEEELMAVLAQSEAQQGRRVTTQTESDLSRLPEVSYFKHKDDVIGDFS